MSDDMNENEKLVSIFEPSSRVTSGADHWDSLREEMAAWRNLEYEWIAVSAFMDQIIHTRSSPIHAGSAVYMLGPDVSGPTSENPDWPENLLYLAPSVEEWLARVQQYGDEYSVAPGSIAESLADPEEYCAIYRALNPGLPW
jgi:hypothetical protein